MSWKKNIDSRALALLLSALTLVINQGLWIYLFQSVQEKELINVLFLSSFFLFYFCLLNIFYFIFLLKYIGKIFIPLILTANAVAFYFMKTYGVIIDKTALLNLIETDPKEVSELLTWKFFTYVIILGIVPTFIFLKLKLDHKHFRVELKKRLLFLTANAVGAIFIFLVFNKQYTSFLRTHREIKHYALPLNYLDGSRAFLGNHKWERPPLRVLANDMSTKPSWNNIKNKTVVILVVGETARTFNFSINGYKRVTNPSLAQINDLVSFKDVSSCGTSTAISLPCLFSNQTREFFNEENYQENILDLIAKTGFKVLWRDNNSGCKGVCERIDYQSQESFRNKLSCPGPLCFDESLLEKLDDYISTAGDKVFIVLHQLGSHGPAYYLRYPQSFRKFTPECKSEQLGDCTREEVVNAYDNTIYYTDYFLGQVINFLKKYDTANTALFYISDHGESLGEKNLYLHGIPYWMAPQEQTKIPMIFWSSLKFDQSFNLDKHCLKANENKTLSHDYVFHSLLGLLDISTSIYKEKLDLFRPCKTTNSLVHQ